MRLELRRHHRQAGERVIIEIRLLYLSVPDRDFKSEGGAQAVDGAALQLRLNRIGVHGQATVDRSNNTVDSEVASIADRHLNRVGSIPAKREVRGDADTFTSRQSFAIADSLSDKFQQA